MYPNSGRESAHVVSRITDSSKISSATDYLGLFACITPKGPLNQPTLVRDVEDLDVIFGDPRINPTLYKDLYSIRELLQTKFSVYISRVDSGSTASFTVETLGSGSSGPSESTGFTIPCLVPAISIEPSETYYLIDIQMIPDETNSFVLSVSTLGDPDPLLDSTTVVTWGDVLSELEALNLPDLVVHVDDESIVITNSVSLTTKEDSGDPENLYAGTAYKVISMVSTGLHSSGFVVSVSNELSVYDDSNTEVPLEEFYLSDPRQAPWQYTPSAYFSPLDWALPYYPLEGIYYNPVDSPYLEVPTKAPLLWTAPDGSDPYRVSLTGDLDSGFTLNYYNTPYDEAEILIFSDPVVTVNDIIVLMSPYGLNLESSNPYSVLVDPFEYESGSGEIWMYSMQSIYLKPIDPDLEDVDLEVTLEEGDYSWNDEVTFTITSKSSGTVIESFVFSGWGSFTSTTFSLLIKPSPRWKPTPSISSYPSATTGPVGPATTAQTLMMATAEIAGDMFLEITVKAVLPTTAPRRMTCILRMGDVVLDSVILSLPTVASGMKNTSFVENINSVFGKYLHFTVVDTLDPNGVDIITILNQEEVPNLGVVTVAGVMQVTLANYITAIEKLVDVRYSGNFISELSSPVVETIDGVSTSTPLSPEDRRALHYTIKLLAAQRKDVTCVFSTPNYTDAEEAISWVASTGEYNDLWEYGNIAPTGYAEQSFYCEMYWSWLKWKVTKVVNNTPSFTTIQVAPAIFVIINSLNAYRTRGIFYPVAGNQGGVLPDGVTVVSNPVKTTRDALVSNRINPIYDTGTRGVQIYGNETLNATYSDLSAAHIARTLVYIRSQVDNYSEKVKFSLNNLFTWTSWINYVTSRILDPIKSAGGLQWFSVDMGTNTTTKEEIAQRKIKGIIKLQFAQSLEIIDLNFDIQASSLYIEK